MNQYQITTAQNVTIKLTIANMGDRVLAGLIDLLILGGYLALLSYIQYKLDIHILRAYDYTFWAMFSFTLPIYFYSLLFEYFWNGQTPGKRLRKIKVVRMDGESLTLGNCIIRWLFRLVDRWLDTGSVGIVAATFSKTHQRIGDMVAGTIVISTRDQADTDISRYADHNATGAIHFPQVESLRLRDMELVNEALTLYYEQDKFDYVLQASAQLKRALDVTPEIDDLTFVKRVVTDYNQLHKVPFA
jgi:uncharacterized RDD family membrane protein YckC